MRLLMGLNRRDIVLVNFNPTKGAEMGNLRPAIVLSDALDNDILPTIIVMPLSTRLEDNALPYRFRIEARTQLLQESDACINEIRALSKDRIKQVLGQITAEEYAILTKALCQLLV
jgi:mRNA interferase MazF